MYVFAGVISIHTTIFSVVVFLQIMSVVVVLLALLFKILVQSITTR